MSRRRSRTMTPCVTPPEVCCLSHSASTISIAGDICLLDPYAVMRQRNCNPAKFNPRERYPNIRPPVSRCSHHKTLEWLEKAMQHDGCFNPERKDDALKIWLRSPHKNTLSYYGVGNPKYGPPPGSFNKVLRSSLKHSGNARRVPRPKVAPPPTSLPKRPPRPAPVCRPYILNPRALQEELHRMPMVRMQLRPSEAFSSMFCKAPVDPEDPLGVKEARKIAALGKALERPAKPSKQPLRVKQWYCPPKCGEKETKCTDYEWAKYKLDSRPCDEAFQRLLMDQTEVQPDQEPQSYEQLYKRIQACFEVKPEPDPECMAMVRCCPEMHMPGGGSAGDGEGGGSAGGRAGGKSAEGGVGGISAEGDAGKGSAGGGAHRGTTGGGSRGGLAGGKTDGGTAGDGAGGGGQGDGLAGAAGGYALRERLKPTGVRIQEDKDKDKDMDMDRDKDRYNTNKNRDKNKDKNRDKDTDNDKDRDKSKDKDKDKDDKSKGKDRDKDKDKDTDKVKNAGKDRDTSKDKSTDKDKDKDEDKNKDKGKEREKEKDKSGGNSEDNNKDKDKGKIKTKDEAGGEDSKADKRKKKDAKKWQREADLNLSVDYGAIQPVDTFDAPTPRSSVKVPFKDKEEDDLEDRYSWMKKYQEMPKETPKEMPEKKPKKPRLKRNKSKPTSKSKSKNSPASDKDQDNDTNPCPPCPPVGCPCGICKVVYAKPVEDSPIMQDLLREAKQRELREYLRTMRHREYLECGGPQCQVPPHRVDPITCDDRLYRNPQLTKCCDCLGALQRLQRQLDKRPHQTLNHEVNSILRDLRSRVARRLCESIEN